MRNQAKAISPAQKPNSVIDPAPPSGFGIHAPTLMVELHVYPVRPYVDARLLIFPILKSELKVANFHG